MDFSKSKDLTLTFLRLDGNAHMYLLQTERFETNLHVHVEFVSNYNAKLSVAPIAGLISFVGLSLRRTCSVELNMIVIDNTCISFPSA